MAMRLVCAWAKPAVAISATAAARITLFIANSLMPGFEDESLCSRCCLGRKALFDACQEVADIAREEFWPLDIHQVSRVRDNLQNAARDRRRHRLHLAQRCDLIVRAGYDQRRDVDIGELKERSDREPCRKHLAVRGRPKSHQAPPNGFALLFTGRG